MSQSATLDQTIHLLTDCLSMADLVPEGSRASFRAVINTLINYALWLHDMMLLGEYYNYARSPNEQALFGVLMSLTTHEAFDDFAALFGGKLRESLKQMNAPLDAFQAVGSVHKRLHSLRSDHGDLLKRVRNSASAHRDHDALEQLTTRAAAISPEGVAAYTELLQWGVAVAYELPTLLVPVLAHLRSVMRPKQSGGSA